MSDLPTNFSESNALLALDQDQPDYAEARAILADYSKGELIKLRKQADRLSDFCDVLLAEKREEEKAEELKNFRDPRPIWCGLKHVHRPHGLRSDNPCPGLDLEQSQAILS